MNEQDKPKSWEYLPSDTKDSFAAFTVYRDLLQERSAEKVARQCKKGVSIIRRWSNAHNWVQRSADYDAHLDGQYRKIAEDQHIEALKDFRLRMLDNSQRTSNLAIKLLERTEKRLNDNYDETPGTIASMARSVAALSEIALQQEATALGVDDLLRRLSAE